MSRRSIHAVLFLALCSLVVFVARVSASTPPIVINELLVGNASTNLDPQFKNFGGWVELFNTGLDPVNLSGYTLSDDNGQPDMWTLPAGTQIPAGGFLLIWLDEEGAGIHANFKADMRGGNILLFMPDDTLVTALTYTSQRVDISYGRGPGGSGDWFFYDLPTPGAANTTTGITPVSNQVARPVFSIPGGIYAAAQSVEITAATGATIHYTTDGSKPTTASPVYTGPIAVNSPQAIRARAFAPGKLASAPATATYLIGVQTDLPVVSLATDPANFFDPGIGIYYGTRNLPSTNYNQSWERPVSMELYETTGLLGFQQDVGVEIHGTNTRSMPQKSLEIKARREYGDNDIDYQIFPDNDLDEYRRLVLRGGGNHGANVSIIREPLNHLIHADTMDLDMQQYRPVVVFINGQYWGIYGLRDKADEALIEQNYDLDADDEFDMIKAEDRISELDAGNFDAWNAFYAALQLDLTNPVNYANVIAQMDLTEYMDHQIVEIYSTNFISAEYRYWRSYEPGSVWRWVLIDMDDGMNIKKLKENTLQKGLPRKYVTSMPLRWLLANPEFRAQFAQRFASHLNITYAPAHVIGVIDEMSAAIATEVPNQVARWKMPKQEKAWLKELDNLRLFATERPEIVWKSLNAYLRKPGTTQLTVNVVEDGRVLVAGVPPFAFPYTGTYFRTLPLTLQAVPADGFRFVEWQETGQTSAEISLTLTGPRTLTAVFEPIP